MCNAHLLNMTCPVSYAAAFMSGAFYHLRWPLCTAYCSIQLWVCHALCARHHAKHGIANCSFLMQGVEQQSDQQCWCCQNAEHARSAVCCCDFIACVCHKFARAVQSAFAKPRTGQLSCRSSQACWEGCCWWPGGIWPTFSQGCVKMSSLE